jgi:hypothetical protein
MYESTHKMYKVKFVIMFFVKMVKGYKIVKKVYRPRCSGYGVFPNGRKCKGCPDCGSSRNKNPEKVDKVAVKIKSKKK